MAHLTKILKHGLHALFPNFCVTCQTHIKSNYALCEHCLNDLRLFDLSKHANLLHRPDICDAFPDCHFDHLIACAWYEAPMKLWLKQLKFSDKQYYKIALQQVIYLQLQRAKAVNESWPDEFIIMPLHNKRFIKRGYNQVSQTWQPVLKAMNLVVTEPLVKQKATIAQARLRARAGQYNDAVKIYNRLFKSNYPNIEFELEHINWLAQDENQYQQALRGYHSLMNRYPNSGRFELAYARHLLKQNPANKEALTLLSHYAHSNQYSVEAEFAWLNALQDMPLNKSTEHAYERYFAAYPKSSKGHVQFSDFKKAYKAEREKLADPAYQTWLKGNVELEKRRFVKAEALFNKALKVRPHNR